MQISLGGRRLVIGSKILQLKKEEKLVFTVVGDVFPRSTYANNTGSYDTTSFRFVSSVDNNKIKIDYKDGNIIEYDFISKVFDIRPDNFGNYPQHVYTDSNQGKRNIEISFRYPEKVTEMYIRFMDIYGVFPSSILTLLSLDYLYINQSKITSFPEQISSLPITRMSLQDIGTAISQRFPDAFLNLPLVLLSLDGSIDFSDVYSSNLYSICESNIKNTIDILSIRFGGITELPANFDNLKVRDLRIGGNPLTEVPSILNNMPLIERLYIRSCLFMQGQTSFSNLINLKYVEFTQSSSLVTDLPLGIENCVLLKSYIAVSVYTDIQRLDEFVDNFYDLTVSEASIVVGNTKFRQMTISTASSIVPTPSGTYQQPTGFVLGSSNGTPASPLEKIWVMVNQYEHTWSY